MSRYLNLIPPPKGGHLRSSTSMRNEERRRTFPEGPAQNAFKGPTGAELPTTVSFNPVLVGNVSRPMGTFPSPSIRRSSDSPKGVPSVAATRRMSEAPKSSTGMRSPGRSEQHEGDAPSKEQGVCARPAKRLCKTDGEPAPKRAAPDLSSPHNECVKILVGKDPETAFTVHKAFLVHHSPYFERFFKDAEESLFVNQDDMPTAVYQETSRDAFGLFTRFIYRGTIKDNGNNTPPIGSLVRLWVLASKISTPELQNLVMRDIFENKSDITVGGYDYIYRHTAPGNPFRRLIVDHLMRNLLAEKLREMCLESRMPKKLLGDLTIAQKKLLLSGSSELPTLRLENYYVRSNEKKD